MANKGWMLRNSLLRLTLSPPMWLFTRIGMYEMLSGSKISV